jgi:flagellar biosynthesis/type III secretory pathway ATPase
MRPQRITVSVLVAVNTRYTTIRIGKPVVGSILDDEGSTLDGNRMAREEKADSEVSVLESYATRPREMMYSTVQ